jgi:type IV pilus assembly protein PilC
MAEFVCKVGTPTGEVVERSFIADDEAALRADLDRQGYYLFNVRRSLMGGAGSLRRERVKPAVLLLFSQELAALLKAGLPLFQALDVMLERQKDALFRRSLAAVRERVKSGTALSEAFRAEGERYPPIFAASLVAGERSGSLETVLRRFVQYERLSASLKKKAVAASVYPAVLMTLMSVLVTVLLIKVIPAFEGFFEGFDAKLPAATLLLMRASALVRGGFVWIALALAAAALSGALWLRRPGSGETLDRVLLRLPYLGGMLRMYATSQLARTLSTLLAGGLPLLTAMEVASQSVSNQAMAAALRQAAPRIREGQSLMTALESTGLLDNVALEMVKVGEQTGALSDMLTAVSEFFDEELDTRIATVLALVEPVMLVLMAVVVGAMLLAFYLPLFQIFSVIAR